MSNAPTYPNALRSSLHRNNKSSPIIMSPRFHLLVGVNPKTLCSRWNYPHQSKHIKWSSTQLPCGGTLKKNMVTCLGIVSTQGTYRSIESRSPCKHLYFGRDLNFPEYIAKRWLIVVRMMGNVLKKGLAHVRSRWFQYPNSAIRMWYVLKWL